MTTPPPDPQDITRLRVAVGRLHRRLAQRSTSELTFAQISALVMVEKHGPIRQGELAAREKVAAPSMTRTVSGLVEAGLVQKIPDPEDGRSCHIVVTEAARTLLEKVRTERSAMLAERAARLSPQQYETLVAALPVLEQLAEEAD
ncbi:MarR family winged helix-turn-helix transcriptional regulator [Actinocrinis sp.]|uniref:MarR family winged helix-turn-helix transcriptional regulator n=1 Tax=Actinocrinis sp. TaxID=1920516 RepID=UPI002B9B0F0F|nr:MarR family transcriptional regulator [Actinocrinis sp.]HXR72075.1 MarR family transcriptional regulator [Actinocrinis sp.]